MFHATVAARRMTLVGCDTMHNADCFSLFQSDGGVPDFYMNVAYAQTIDVPRGTTLGEHNKTRWGMGPDGTRFMVHTDGRYLLEFDETFSKNHLTLRRGIPQADILHYLYVSHCFSYHLLSGGDCALHAAALKCGENGIALCGRSGTGKSTLSKLWTAQDDTVSILCEDVPAVTMGDTVTLCGTPFCGQDRGVENDQAPLRGIVLLKRGNGNRVTALPPSRALFELLDVFPRPYYHRALHEASVDIAQSLVTRVPIWVFEHDATPAALEALKTTLSAAGWI